VVCHLGANEMVAVFRDRVHLKPGEVVRLRPDIAKSHLFDRQSGKVIK
jgi:multiple sugar transport system ATP-binding protein